ncbi:hypothetical protein K505DRAFT_295179 [Melanomma pulvis-pyrius CBS 109.77]|uniref:FAS1 domain-containing protein n=1 Tax=Melanomma pulvis-pyrius CBS 109.77 TaxID=1314802 RepID=A0A6A6XS96_9PLEO|nr:hypothetical protein K505DRAFT_295179 [Melanomma pulvis-pyrius CBS 109.77]
MKPTFLCACPVATICLVLVAFAESRPFNSINKLLFSAQSLLGKHNGPVSQIMPPSDEVSTGVIISDVIGKTQDIAIFSGLTRDVDTISGRLEDAAQNATVLAPNNTAMKNLKRKPWEDPKDYEALGTGAYKGGDGEDRAHKNLRTFVEAHIVPQSPWEEGQKVKTLAGNEIWWEIKDGKKNIQPSDVEVTSIADKVSNGEVWIIGGSLV